MADTKISALTGSTTPLAGTEVLPIVQSGATKKITTDDLTVKNIRSNATTGILQVAGPATAATRTMIVPDANFTAARTDAAQTFTGAQTFLSSVTGSVFKTSNDTTSAANNTATTIFTAATLNNGTYIVSCNVPAADPVNYSAVSLVTVDVTVLRVTALQTAALLAITASGQNIQATQLSGSTANIVWAVTRVA
jgi:hypothetical protein